MYKPMNDILTRLQNGETAEAIAADFTTKMNEAIASYEAEQKAKIVEAEKIAATRNVINALNEYMRACHPDSELAAEASNAITDEDCRDFMEQIDAFVDLFDACATAFAPINISVKTPEGDTVNIKGASPAAMTIDSIFENFFKDMNI